MKQSILVLLVIGILLTSCSNSPAQITEPTVASPSSVVPTITSAPTLTPIPENTATPTAEPSPTPVPIVAINAKNADQLDALFTLDEQNSSNHAIFSPDGKFITALDMKNYLTEEPQKLKYWDIQSRSFLPPVVLDLFPRSTRFAFDPSGTLFAMASADTDNAKLISVHQLTDGKQVVSADYQNQRLGHVPNDIKWSPDGRYIVMGLSNGQIQAYDASDLNRVFDVKIQPKEVNAVAQIHAIAFSPDSNLLATVGQDKVVRIWNISDWSEKISFEKSEATMYDVVFSPDGKFLAVAESGGVKATDPGQLSVWDVETGKKLKDFNPQYKVFSVEYSPDGSLLVTGGQDGHVRVWRTDTYEMIADLTGHKTRVASLDFSPDGTLLASGSISTFNIYESDPDKQGFIEQVILWGLP